MERAAFEVPPRKLGEEPLDRVEPRARGRCEALVAVEPDADLGVLVDGVIVEDQVDLLALRHRDLNRVEEADEFLMAMALHVAADDGSIENIESGEQGRRAVALVVVGHCASASLLHRQARLGPVERLDLALIVDWETIAGAGGST